MPIIRSQRLAQSGVSAVFAARAMREKLRASSAKGTGGAKTIDPVTASQGTITEARRNARNVPPDVSRAREATPRLPMSKTSAVALAMMPTAPKLRASGGTTMESTN